jgi:hemerythrin
LPAVRFSDRLAGSGAATGSASPFAEESVAVSDRATMEPLVSGYRPIDNEHHLQLSLLAAVRRAVLEKLAQQDVEDILDRFVDFSKVHFASETTLMRLYQYPSYAAHTAEHDRTMEQLEALRSDWRAGRVGLTLDRVDLLADWIQEHIGSADRAFGRYLVRLGVGPG